MGTHLYTKHWGIRSNTNLPVNPITDFESVKNSEGKTLGYIIDELLKDINTLNKKIKELEKEISELKTQKVNKK